jgi:hypothetical protein
MKTTALILGIVFLIIAALIYIFGTGLRVVYSGGFFTVVGVLAIIYSRRRKK